MYIQENEGKYALSPNINIEGPLSARPPSSECRCSPVNVLSRISSSRALLNVSIRGLIQEEFVDERCKISLLVRWEGAVVVVARAGKTHVGWHTVSLVDEATSLHAGSSGTRAEPVDLVLDDKQTARSDHASKLVVVRGPWPECSTLC